MNDSIHDLIDMLQSQLESKNKIIESFKRRNNGLIAINNEQRKKYKKIIVLISILLALSFGFNIYHLLL